MDSYELFYNKALKFLSYRPRSVKEVRGYLNRLVNKKNKKIATTETQKDTEAQNFSDSKQLSDSVVAGKAFVIDQVIAKLKEQSFVNDIEFAKWWIEQRSQFKAKGLRFIKLELKQKGIDEEIIDQAIQDRAPDVESEVQKAKRLVEKQIGRYKGLEKRELYAKLGQFLARRGFDFTIIRQAIDEVLKKEV